MKELEHYSPYDTVELSYPRLLNNSYRLKSFLLSYYIHTTGEYMDEYYSDVFVGLPNENLYNFMGDNVMLKTTRMILIEKYDYRLMEATKCIPSGFSTTKQNFEYDR